MRHNPLIILAVTTVAALSLGACSQTLRPAPNEPAEPETESPATSTATSRPTSSAKPVAGDGKSAHVDCTDIFQKGTGTAEAHLVVDENEAIRIESHLTSGSVKVNFGTESQDGEYAYVAGERSTEWRWSGDCNMTLTPSYPDGDGETVDGTIDILVVSNPSDAPLDYGGGHTGGGDIVFGDRLIVFNDLDTALAYAGYPDTGLPKELSGKTGLNAAAGITVEDMAPYPVVTAWYGEEVQVQKARGHEMDWHSPFRNEPGTSFEKKLTETKKYKTPYGETEVEFYEDYWSEGDGEQYIKWSITDANGIEWQYQAKISASDTGEDLVSLLK